MKSIWQEQARQELNDRVGALAWDRRGEWGRFTAPKMMCHLADSLKMAMGDLKVTPKNLPIRYPPLKQLIIYVAPFPKPLAVKRSRKRTRKSQKFFSGRVQIMVSVMAAIAAKAATVMRAPPIRSARRPP